MSSSKVQGMKTCSLESGGTYCLHNFSWLGNILETLDLFSGQQKKWEPVSTLFMCVTSLFCNNETHFRYQYMMNLIGSVRFLFLCLSNYIK